MPKLQWDSSRTQSDTHPIKAHDRFFRTHVAAEEYKAGRNARGRAARNGFPGTVEGVERFLEWEKANCPPKPMADTEKVAKIRDLIDSDDLSLAEFGHRVVEIIEDRA